MTKIFNRFAVIDFETADYGRDSACSISVIVVEKRKIVKKTSVLIRPPRRDFIFSYLHGITWRDVAKKPKFGEVWPKINSLLNRVEFIAAHNASFDREVLHACCAKSSIAPPNIKYLCTMKLARHLWGLYPTKLSDVSRHFGISLKHHDAESDAIACAKIVLEAFKKMIPASAFLGSKADASGNGWAKTPCLLNLSKMIIAIAGVNLVRRKMGYRIDFYSRIDCRAIKIEIRSMFPTHVGMNRKWVSLIILSNYVPHARGDEPNIIYP